jgi:uncharacterized protein
MLTASLLVFACTGEDGAPGANGTNGADGAKGTNGTNGTNGLDGKAGNAGPKGADGDDGDAGPAGPQGPEGPGTSWLSFANLSFPRTTVEKHQVRASAAANVDGNEVAIGYHAILRSGQDPAKNDKSCDLVASPSTCAGAQLDKNGVIMKDDGGQPMVTNQNDFSSLLEVGGNKFLVHSFEANPSPIFVTKLSQAADTGMLAATSTKSADLSSIDGLYRSCAGSITPWGTHISAEEAQVDARIYDAATNWATLSGLSRFNEVRQMVRYLGVNVTGAEGDFATFQAAYSAYFHGYAVEVKLAADGTPEVKKHYAMGRLGMELAYVMPDKKTVFLTDDVTNGAFHMFVADTAGDLSAGTLYSMRVYQTSPAGESVFTGDIEWISLGHATDAEIRALIHPAAGTPRVKFQDMFEIGDVSACPSDFKLVRGSGDNTNLECLKVKPNMDLAASRLESRRYAATKGATTELTKEEGLTYDPDTNRLYIGISDIGSSMGSQTGGDNHINVKANPCGAVFALDVGAITDAAGKKITDYGALNWYPLVTGREASYPTGSEFAGNTCSVTGIASPDNVTYLPRYKVLMIGEDASKGHQNDAMWAYHVPSGTLTRVLTTPYGSEVTSPYWVPNLGNRGYLVTAVQHPYGEDDFFGSTSGHKDEPESSGTASWIGVIGPFPKLN